MFPGFYFFDKSKLTPVKLKGLVNLLGVLGSTIRSTGILSTFSTIGNRCCSSNDRIFVFNYDGDMYILDAISIKSSLIVKASVRPVLLRNCGSTCNSRYVYVVNGTTNGIGGLLGVPSNSFQRYDIVSNTWSTLSSMPLLSTAVRMFRYKEYIYIVGGLTGILEYSIRDNTYRVVNSVLSLAGDICAGGELYSTEYVDIQDVMKGFARLLSWAFLLYWVNT